MATSNARLFLGVFIKQLTNSCCWIDTEKVLENCKRDEVDDEAQSKPFRKINCAEIRQGVSGTQWVSPRVPNGQHRAPLFACWGKTLVE